MLLNLNKSLYWKAEAPCLWYKNLEKGIEAWGFKKSDAYPCIFISNKLICVVYVDDGLFWDQSQTYIE